MNKLFFAPLFLILILLSTGCHLLDDDDLNFNQNPNINLPSQAQNFIDSNYNGYSIEETHEEDLCDDIPVFEVELEDGPGPDVDLYFDQDWNFLFQATDIQTLDLPTAVMDTIQSQYPDYSIKPDDLERFDFPDGSVQYEVELTNGDNEVELVLTEDGTIVCANTDDDDDGDDDNGDDDDDDGDDDDNNNGNGGTTLNLPADVLDFIDSNYTGYSIEEAHEEDLCDDIPVFEVELEDGLGPDVDLYFDQDWNFLFQATDIQTSDLPAAVTAMIQATYPGYTIETDDLERFDFPDGSVQYKVELENGDDDVELVLNEDGTIVCEED